MNFETTAPEETSPSEFWFNIETRQVEEGVPANKNNVMGPYSSYDEASRALDKAAENTRRWDEAEDDDA